MRILQFLAFLWVITFTGSSPVLAVAPPATDRHLNVNCREPFTVKKDSQYQTLVGDLEAIGARDLQCFSCYRDPGYQAQLCESMCGKQGRTKGCPGRCAAPGKSQHQKKQLVTCDLKGIPAGKAGCEMLKKLCDEKYGGKCGIGGYPSGSFHFGVHDDHFSSWNQCRNLKWNVVGRAKAMLYRWNVIKNRNKP